MIVSANINSFARPLLDALYQKHGEQKNIDPLLLKAIAIVESNENPNAVNPNDPSYGLMQIYYVKGKTNLPAVKDFPPDTYTRLYDPDYNLHIASQILRWNIDTYGTKKAIAVYNCWKAKEDPKEGEFRNQAYVDKVLKQYDKLRTT